jgi:transposase-like protein
MGKIRRKFDLPFKQKIIQQIEAGEMSQSEAARKYQLSVSLVQKWREQLQKGTLRQTPSKEIRMMEDKIAKLERKVGQLVMDNEFLKKLHTYARQRRNVDTSVITAKNVAQFQEDVGS